MSQGYIRLWRKLQESHLWQEKPFSRGQAWIDLLLLANHRDGYYRIRGVRVDVKRGQVGTSSKSLAKKWGWSRGKVLRFLSELETVQQVVQQKTNVCTLICVTNYSNYQHDGTAGSTANGTANGTQTDTNKNVKNEEEVKNKDMVPAATSICQHQKIIEIYHDKLPTLPRIKIWSDKRKTILKARWNEKEERQNLEWWKRFFQKISESDFLTGKTEKPFFPNLEWFITQGNFIKVIEGNYKNKTEAGQKWR